MRRFLWIFGFIAAVSCAGCMREKNDVQNVKQLNTENESEQRSKKLLELANTYLKTEYEVSENLYVLNVYKSKILISINDVLQSKFRHKIDARIAEDFITKLEPIGAFKIAQGSKVTVRSVRTTGRSPVTDVKNILIVLQSEKQIFEINLSEFERMFIFRESKNVKMKEIFYPKKLTLCRSKIKTEYTDRISLISELDRRLDYLKSKSSQFNSIFETYIIGDETQSQLKICYLVNISDELALVEAYTNAYINLSIVDFRQDEL